MKEELKQHTGDQRSHEVSIATGILAEPYIRQAVAWIKEKYPSVRVRIYPIQNDFFGERITVAGLLTGRDLKAQLMDQPLGEKLLISGNMLRSGEQVFLDDVTVQELERSLQTEMIIVKSSGKDFVRALLLKEQTEEQGFAQPYEVKEYE